MIPFRVQPLAWYAALTLRLVSLLSSKHGVVARAGTKSSSEHSMLAPGMLEVLLWTLECPPWSL